MTEQSATSSEQSAANDESLSNSVDEYRRVREELERGVLPLATSVDGRQFTFQASLHGLTLQTGGYVILEGAEGEGRLGQILTMRSDTSSVQPGAGPAGSSSGIQIRAARGDGTILDGIGQPFHDARVRPATPAEVEAWFVRVRPHRSALAIGELLLAPGVTAALDAGGFNRHTFMCGQSGSGKTYSLGLVLERLLVDTSLQMIILDPNSDYVRLAEMRESADPSAAAAYASAAEGVAVWQNAPEAAHPLRLQFADVDTAAQAAVFGLDPIKDREEYAALSGILAAGRKGQALITGLDALVTSENPDVRQLGLRAANLGLMNWSIWSRGQGRSLVDELEQPTSRCLVIDLGSLDSIAEQRLIAETVLSTLWRNRARRQPCLVVIDEAHNVCPSAPTDAVTGLAANYAALIAAEGRKFGLYLLTSTQRPQKVNEEVLTQCDNLLLMRMNSDADLEYLRETFSFVPSGLIRRATTFGLGETLVGGKFFPHPTYVKFGARMSQEGGADIPTAWANAGELGAGPPDLGQRGLDVGRDLVLPNPELGQDAVVVLGLEQREEQVLGADVVVIEPQGFPCGQLEDLDRRGVVRNQAGQGLGRWRGSRRARQPRVDVAEGAVSPGFRWLPGRPRLADVLVDGVADGGEEVRRVDRAGQLVTLDLVPDGVLHRGEDQRDAPLVEPVVQLLQHVRGRGVDVRDGFGGDDDPAQAGVLVGDLAHMVSEGAGVGEDEGRVEAVDDQAGKVFGLGMVRRVVQPGQSVDSAELDLVRPPRAAEHVEDRQADSDGDAGQHAEERDAEQRGDRECELGTPLMPQPHRPCDIGERERRGNDDGTEGWLRHVLHQGGREDEHERDDAGPDHPGELGTGAGLVGHGSARSAGADRETLEQPGGDVGRADPDHLLVAVDALAASRGER